MKASLYALLGFCGLAVIITIFLSNELNRAAVYNSVGYIKSGRRFSVTIGDSRDEAKSRIINEHGLKLKETYDGTKCLMREFSSARTIDVFVDESWRRGTICLISDKQFITEVAWYYDFSSP